MIVWQKQLLPWVSKAKHFMVLNCSIIFLFSVSSFPISRHERMKVDFFRLHEFSQDQDSSITSVRLLDDSLLSESSAADFIRRLNELKLDKQVTKWNSTLMDIRATTTKLDIQLVSRTSFSSPNYFEDIIEGARKSQQQGSIEMPFIAVSASSFLISAVVIPLLSIPDWAKNVFGSIFLLTPFLLILINLAAPGLYLSLQKKNSMNNDQDLNERILYHEAGHLLAGYLCGVPVISYDTSGDRDAGTTIELDISEKSTMVENMQVIKNKAGNLLVVSMAGMVSETLRFGDSKGGAEDLLFATEILRLLRTPNDEKEGSLR
jgi:hypothetical protein